MEEEYGVKAYVQKTLGVDGILDIIGFSLGANKIYNIKGDRGEKINFNPLEKVCKDNYAHLNGISRTDNCSIDIFIDKKGNSYVALNDPSFLFHAFKFSEEPFNPILNGKSLSITFSERDSLSLALAVNIVNIMGGEVHLDGLRVHQCSNKDAQYPLLTKEEMDDALENGGSELSNSRFYHEHDIFRKTKAIEPSFLQQLHEANPDLDKGKLALRRIKKYCENYSPDVDKTIKLKLGA